jgi:thiol-disulfide isomerase/thioredoxin
MRRSKLILSVTLLVLILCVGLYFFVIRSSVTSPYETEDLLQAPAFSLPDASGNILSLSDIEGKVTIIHFWASWSPYSKEELTSLVQLKKEYGDAIAIVALNRDHSPAEGKAYLESLQLGDALLFVYDKDDTYFKKVSGYAVPETLFLIENENIFYHQHGPMKYDEMKAQVMTVLQ